VSPSPTTARRVWRDSDSAQGGRDERPLRDTTWLRCTEPNSGSGRTARYALYRIHKKDRHRRSAITDNSAWTTEKTGDS